jgi:hypothetical protein
MTISPAHFEPKAAIFRLAAAASFSITRVVRASAAMIPSPIKACCIAAGLPVIDGRMVAFEEVARLAVHGPMIAVGESPSPQPYHALSYAPLAVVASAYRATGAEVFNIGGSGPVTAAAPEE